MVLNQNPKSLAQSPELTGIPSGPHLHSVSYHHTCHK